MKNPSVLIDDLGLFLYNIKSVLCLSFVVAFRQSMDVGIFPSILKISSVTLALFKSEDKSDVRNY